MTVSNSFSLFNAGDIKTEQISSRKTSASTAIQGGSLATVL